MSEDQGWFGEIPLEDLRLFIEDIPLMNAWGQNKAVKVAKEAEIKAKLRRGNVTTRKQKPTLFGEESDA